MDVKIMFLSVCYTGPGGYLQWEEADAVDAYANPDTPDTRQMIKHIIEERVARGLAVRFVQPLQEPSTVHAQSQ